MNIQSCVFRSFIVIAALLLIIAAQTWSQAESDPVSKGNQVYQEKKCSSCHSVQGKGGKAGGDLSHVGAKRDAQWLETFMKNPKAVKPDIAMPAFKGNAEELNALVAYMLSLK